MQNAFTGYTLLNCNIKKGRNCFHWLYFREIMFFFFQFRLGISIITGLRSVSGARVKILKKIRGKKKCISLCKFNWIHYRKSHLAWKGISGPDLWLMSATLFSFLIRIFHQLWLRWLQNAFTGYTLAT